MRLLLIRCGLLYLIFISTAVFIELGANDQTPAIAEASQVHCGLWGREREGGIWASGFQFCSLKNHHDKRPLRGRSRMQMFK